MILRDDLFLLIVFIIFGISALIQYFYYLYYYLSLWFHNHSETSSDRYPVSVIICARNEEENLTHFLPYILEQDYPDYEVIVVNDCSEDNSFDVLGSFLAKYPHLRISTVNKDPKFTHNKKFAQFIGIKAAKNDLLLFTDADCQPESDKWIAGMASHFDDKTDFVIGYGGYLSRKGLLNYYIRYDTMFIAMQYLGMGIRGNPYMGVGRNLAYKRSMFFNNKGYGRFNRLISGDDDLFVNASASGKNTSVEFRKDMHTRSIPAANINEWFAQKKRHLTTARYYRSGDKILLILEPASRLLFYISAVILFVNSFLWPVITVIFGLRLIIQVIIFTLIAKKLNEKGLVTFTLFFDIFSPLVNVIIYSSNFFNRSVRNQWK
jgi:cellulose synthase/poly-beta-1,6-N-acetylglucosamine synthase-like glycosyltransferase